MFQLWHLYVAIVMFHLLHEIMSIVVIKKFCDFMYENLLKQLRFY
jgi:hypothetical protein